MFLMDKGTDKPLSGVNRGGTIILFVFSKDLRLLRSLRVTAYHLLCEGKYVFVLVLESHDKLL